jgi:hypothetical protein
MPARARPVCSFKQPRMPIEARAEDRFLAGSTLTPSILPARSAYSAQEQTPGSEIDFLTAGGCP